MKPIKWMMTLLCCLTLPLQAQAQTVDIQTVPLTQQAEVWLVESDAVPAVTVRMAFRDAGSTSDVAGKEGRARMVAMLLSEGAGNMDALAFNQALENHAIQMHFSADDDLLEVQMTTLSEHLDKAFALLALALTEPRFDDDAVLRVKSQMRSSLRLMEEQPSYAAAKALKEAVYRGHPYANPTEGTHDAIEAVDVADLRDYLDRYVTSGNVLMSVVGDVDASRLQKLTGKHMQKLPAEFRPLHNVPRLVVGSAGQTETLRRSIPQTVVLFAGAGIPRDDKDFYAAFVLNHLLGGGTLTSKLGDEIREKRGLAYYAYSQLQLKDHGTVFGGGFGTRNEQASETLRVTMDTLRATRAGQISQAEVDEAKSYITGAFPLALSSNDGIAAMLLMMQRFRLGKDYLAERNDLMEAVTREDVLRVAKRLIAPHQLTVVGVGDPSENLANHR